MCPWSLCRLEHAFFECLSCPAAFVLSKIITDREGKVVSKEYWGLRTLAYKIKKNVRGHYVLLNIDASFEEIRGVGSASTVIDVKFNSGKFFQDLGDNAIKDDVLLKFTIKAKK